MSWISPKAKSYVTHYAEGVAGSAFNGGIVALGAIIGPGAASVAGFQVPNLTPHQIVATFIGGAALKAFTYFQAHPVPVDDPDAPEPAADHATLPSSP